MFLKTFSIDKFFDNVFQDYGALTLDDELHNKGLRIRPTNGRIICKSLFLVHPESIYPLARAMNSTIVFKFVFLIFVELLLVISTCVCCSNFGLRLGSVSDSVASLLRNGRRG